MSEPAVAPTFILATGNAHKVVEIAAILGEAARCLGLKEFPDAPKAVEDAATFAGNAVKKAATLANWLAALPPASLPAAGHGPLAVLADDSGLEVDALEGAPGVYSARFAAVDQAGAGDNSPDAANNAKLLRLLADVPLSRRTARFRCVLALVPIGAGSRVGEARIFEGACEGRIQFTPAGAGGFGYDPLFVPDGQTCSFAELGEAVKNRLSHRTRALAALRAALLAQ